MPNTSFNERRQLGAFREAISAELTPVIQVKFPYAIEASQVITNLINNGTVVVNNSMAEVSSSAEINSSAEVITEDIVVCQPGQGTLVNFTALFSEPKEGSCQLIGMGNGVDGYYIGYNGLDFSALRIQGGSKTWTSLPIVGDGTDTFIGGIDLTKGNSYQIQYSWTGFGQITYSIFDASLQRYTPLFLDRYQNKHDLPSAFNPDFPGRLFVENTTNDTKLTLKSSSFSAFIEGIERHLGNLFSIGNSGDVTAEAVLFSIRVRSTFHGKQNRSLVFPKILSTATDGMKPVIFRVYKNAIIGGTPTWTKVDEFKSIVEYSTNIVTITYPVPDLTLVAGKEDSFFIDLGKDISLKEGDTYTVTAESELGNALESAITWQELL